jgi:hypothetical protein
MHATEPSQNRNCRSASCRSLLLMVRSCGLGGRQRNHISTAVSMVQMPEGDCHDTFCVDMVSRCHHGELVDPAHEASLVDQYHQWQDYQGLEELATEDHRELSSTFVDSPIAWGSLSRPLLYMTWHTLRTTAVARSPIVDDNDSETIADWHIPHSRRKHACE